MGKKNKKDKKHDKQIDEVRERWFDTIIGSINSSLSLMRYERIYLDIKDPAVSSTVESIINSGMNVLDYLKEDLEDIRENDPEFKYYHYDIYDSCGIEAAYIKLAKETLGSEAAKMMYSGIMACEISMRNRKNRMISKCCCETANLFN